ncbi:MAG: ethanolamine ammonia-lyase subunit EutC [Bacteroidota bacterium]
MDKIVRQSISVEGDPWSPLKQFTQARIALGRTGCSVPTKQTLDLNMAHAHARDAVYAELAMEMLEQQLQIFKLVILHLKSMAGHRAQYLQRPDLGRRLHPTSAEQLPIFGQYPADVAIIIADGLSASGMNAHSLPLLQELIPLLQNSGLTIAPICLVDQGRVAIADDIGSGLKVKLSIILIGERPGLSSADSIGAYLTFNPQPGLTDDARNCISNIRPGGLSFKMAAGKINHLVQEAFRRQLSGVGLKDDMGLIGE